MKDTRTREELIKSIHEKARNNPKYRDMILERARAAQNKNKSSDK